jgi:predicted enzyme related to lactoylglutathione lyase
MSGEIAWVELPAADTTKARTFYGGLFAWTTTEFGGDYHTIDNGPACAIVPHEDAFTHPRVYFATDDVEASVKRVHELGGTAADIQDVPGVGRLVHCQDDQDTPFSLYQRSAQS